MAKANPEGLPDVFAYDDFRAFLRDHYLARKRLDRRFSYGVFAKRAGCASRSHLKLVIDGRQPLTGRFLDGYVRALRLDAEGARLFRLLVVAGQASDPKAREAAGTEIRRLRYDRSHRWLEEGEFRRLSESWSRLMVLGLCRLRGFRSDPAWISRRLGGLVRPAEAREALRFLRDGGYVRFRGRRVERLTKPLGFEPSRAGPPSPTAFGEHAHRLALRIRRERLGGRLFEAGLFQLTKEEARSLYAQVRAALKNGAPRKPSARGELYLFAGDLLQLTGTRPAGAPSRRP